jgi:hypothetical protein
LNEQEFWKLTPASFYALSQRYRDREKEEWRRTYTIVAAIYEVNRNHKKRSKPYTVDDWFYERRRQTPEEMLAVVKGLQAAFSQGG